MNSTTTHLLTAFTAILLLAPLVALHAAEPPDTNYDEAKIPPYTLPDPLVCFDGQRVMDVRLWRAKRRPEILSAFVENVYGRAPKLKTEPRYEVTDIDTRALDGLATRKQVTIRLFSEADSPRIDLVLFIPNATVKPAPAFLSLSYGNQGIHPDPGIKPTRATRRQSEARMPAAGRWR